MFHVAAAAAAAQDNAQTVGVNVVRTWAFCDGSRAGALQPSAYTRDERVFRALDGVLAQARARDLRLVLVLTNYWQDYGARAAARGCLCTHAPAPVCASRAAMFVDANSSHTKPALRVRRHRGVRGLGTQRGRAAVAQRRRVPQLGLQPMWALAAPSVAGAADDAFFAQTSSPRPRAARCTATSSPHW